MPSEVSEVSEVSETQPIMIIESDGSNRNSNTNTGTDQKVTEAKPVVEKSNLTPDQKQILNIINYYNNKYKDEINNRHYRETDPNEEIPKECLACHQIDTHITKILIQVVAVVFKVNTIICFQSKRKALSKNKDK